MKRILESLREERIGIIKGKIIGIMKRGLESRREESIEIMKRGLES